MLRKQCFLHYVAILVVYTVYCGIPSVSMLGSEENWRRLVDKLEKVEVLLQPIVEVLQLRHWFSSCKGVLNKLLETYQGRYNKLYRN